MVPRLAPWGRVSPRTAGKVMACLDVEAIKWGRNP